MTALLERARSGALSGRSRGRELDELSPASDEELMARVQAGDSAAFAQLHDRHRTAARRIATAICRDTRDADDAVQEGFLSLWRARADYRPSVGAFQPWAMTIIRYRAIDITRRQLATSRPHLVEAFPSDDFARASGSVEDEVELRCTSADLRASIRQLPPPQSQAITLAFFGDLSHSEIATRLALPPGTVKGRIRLALERLRVDMQVSA